MTIPESHIRAAADSIMTSSIGKNELRAIAKIMLEALPYAELLAFWKKWDVHSLDKYKIGEEIDKKLKALEGK